MGARHSLIGVEVAALNGSSMISPSSILAGTCNHTLLLPGTENMCILRDSQWISTEDLNGTTRIWQLTAFSDSYKEPT
jgi:hypothetical protein